MKKLLLVAGCLLFAGGCTTTSSSSSGSPPPSPAVASKKDVQVRRRKLSAADMVVRHAHLPIDYLLTAPHIVRINDLTNNTQLWQQHVVGNAHLLVDAHGIHVNATRVYRGKLKKGHVYEVVLVHANGV